MGRAILYEIDIIDQTIILTRFLLRQSTEFQDEPYIDYMESSEDGQEDVAHWVVSGGKKYYEQIIDEPSKIPHTVEGKNDGNLYGIASEVYYSKFQGELDIY